MAELPKYLDDFIFQELMGFFHSGQNVDVNLENGDLANRRYIGTYFPRSVIESYTIFYDLYANQKIKEAFDNLEELKVLDIGTGTGGNLIGLMHFLRYIEFNKPVEFHTVEGNQKAIDYQIKFFNKFNQQFNTNYTLKCVNVIFQPDMFNLQLNDLVKNLGTNYDIITSFKFISEFYNFNYKNAIGLFKNYTKTLSPYLKEKGLFLLLDLVSGNYDHNNPRPFTTQIMSDELNEYVNCENSQLAYILPLSCGFWSEGCQTKKCYIERQFEIKHSQNNRDISRVAYRVMGRKQFANIVLDSVTDKGQYQMSYNSNYPKYCRNTKIFGKINSIKLPNAFKFL